MSGKIRVAIVVSHPIQHFVHLYRALAEQPELDLLVIYASDIGARSYYDKDMGTEIAWKTDLLSGYRHIFLPEASSIMATGFWTVNNPSVVAKLGEFGPDVVQLHGYAQMTLLRALVWCKLKGVPVLLWSDSSLLFQRSFLKKAAKKIVISALMRAFSGVLTTGDNNEAYYRNYGVPSKRLFRCPFTVDKTLFPAALDAKHRFRKELREKYGISLDAFLILFVGKLIPLKRPKDILQAVKQMRTEGFESRVAVFFAGSGVLMSELRDFATENHLQAVFGGFINVDILPSIYAMADVLVFPSDREAYGLSAREAICLGLPLIVSDQIGCVGPSDVARPHENAIVYPAGDVEALAEAISLLARDAALREVMSRDSLRIAAELDVHVSIDGFLQAVRAVAR
jgi:glycosyltransferase involved in cell wall biosynthesis